jgi:hypothetical protein
MALLFREGDISQHKKKKIFIKKKNKKKIENNFVLPNCSKIESENHRNRYNLDCCNTYHSLFWLDTNTSI